VPEGAPYPDADDLGDPAGSPGSDTIAALSTAAGAGAIGIVRLSGPRAADIGARVFRPISLRHRPSGAQPSVVEPVDVGARPLPTPADRENDQAPGAPGAVEPKPESHRLRYGHVVDPGSGRVIDEVLFAFMAGPATYTREDVVEIHCHGGPAAQRAVLQTVLRQGARPADPGEFTKRAFLHGRLDLTQAESVAAVVRAQSASALRAAVSQLQGGLGGRLRDLRRSLVAILAHLEVAIDFSEEDVDDIDRAKADAELAAIQAALDSLLKTAFLGRALEQGVRTAIAGRPNVGKSSLLNALLARERAIVSEIPGTTRDTVEELVEVQGIPLHLVDTAGIRESGDIVERLGIERSRVAVDTADLALLVIDMSAGLVQEDLALLDQLDPRRTIIVANKLDLSDERRAQELQAALGADRMLVAVSARSGQGMDRLRQTVAHLLLGETALRLEEPLLANERQRRLVEEAREAVAAARAGLGVMQPEELVCEDVRSAISALGHVTGEELVPDLLEQIFSHFCIGK
jgi:tRNA modification GTPase